MNQILITKKLYVTPELKRKKKIYKVSFFLSIFAMIVLSCAYIYAEYDRYRQESVSQDLLSKLIAETMKKDTTIAPTENALIISMTQEQIVEENVSSNEALQAEEKNTISTGKFSDEHGTEYNAIGYINIPKIECKYPIIDRPSQELMDKLLKVSVCKFWGSDPNEVGNLCIVGHNYKNSKFFSKVPSMVVGDTVEITDLSGKTLKYEAYDIYTVDPSDTRCTSQLTQGRKEITLITCTDDGKNRVIAKAKLVE